MKKLSAFIILYILTTVFLLGENFDQDKALLDSLWNTLMSCTSDSLKIELYRKAGIIYNQTNPDSAERINNCLNRLGIICMQQGDYSNAGPAAMTRQMMLL